MKIRLRRKKEKAIEQSKLTDKYVVYYFCEMWDTGGQNNGHPSGYSVYQNGNYIKSLSFNELQIFEKENKIEWLKTAKEIRKILK
jgi:hypothetical protein